MIKLEKDESKLVPYEIKLFNSLHIAFKESKTKNILYEKSKKLEKSFIY